LSIFNVRETKKAFRAQVWEGLSFLLANRRIFISDNAFSQEVASLIIRVLNNLTLKKAAKF
jgi:hypothetical protein